jgi:hypothetical protein
MAICRLILKMTGEDLSTYYWTPCVQIIRTFFDLWLFLDLESIWRTVELYTVAGGGDSTGQSQWPRAVA